MVDFTEDYEDVSVDGAAVQAREGRKVTYRFSRDALSASQLIQLLAARYKIADLTVRRIYEENLLKS